MSIADWVAFQVLQGDETNWQSTARAFDGEVLSAQWHQLAMFTEKFFELSAAEKLQQFQLLEAHLHDNPVALQYLERYRQFLDLDADGTEGETPDAAVLIRSLVKQTVSGPLERQSVVNKLLTTTSTRPLRWRRAAIELQRHPRFSELAPLLLDRIARIDREQDARQLANRRSFKRRFGSRILGRRFKRLMVSAGLPLALMLVPGFVLFVATMNRHTPRTTMPEFRYQYRPGAPDFTAESLNELLLDVETSGPLAEVLGQDAFKHVETFKAQWEETARTRGSDGLTEIEAKLASASDQAGDRALQLFKAWRIKYGDAIAKSADEQAIGQASSAEPGKFAPVPEPDQDGLGHDE